MKKIKIVIATENPSLPKEVREVMLELTPAQVHSLGLDPGEQVFSIEILK
jgi:hypothetical protein